MKRRGELSTRRGLLAYLVAVLLVALIPAFGLGVLAVVALANSYRDAFEAQLRATARSVANSLDETLEAHLALGRILAASNSLAVGNLDAFEAEARAAGQSLDCQRRLKSGSPALGVQRCGIMRRGGRGRGAA